MRSILESSAMAKTAPHSRGMSRTARRKPISPRGAFFLSSTNYFGESKSQLMRNYVVDDLDAMFEALRRENVPVEPKVEA